MTHPVRGATQEVLGDGRGEVSQTQRTRESTSPKTSQLCSHGPIKHQIRSQQMKHLAQRETKTAP